MRTEGHHRNQDSKGFPGGGVEGGKGSNVTVERS